jgi:hypothetical protein
MKFPKDPVMLLSAVNNRIVLITASGACTRIDESAYSYVESISNGVAVDESGCISVK